MGSPLLRTLCLTELDSNSINDPTTGGRGGIALSYLPNAPALLKKVKEQVCVVCVSQKTLAISLRQLLWEWGLGVGVRY
uniref:Uncharacterized protein n=1 Tax=Kalanchoe fedtschenkoi TaxID=63787 RepID=A0A7N0V1W6_KALFE